MNVYDFDGTIYAGDSTVDFYRFVLMRRPGLLRFLPGQVGGMLLFLAGRKSRMQMKECFFRFLLKIDGEAMAEEFWQSYSSRIYPWYLSRMQSEDVIISASPEFLLRPICRKLGIGGLIASPVDVRTGHFLGKNCRGEEKVRRFCLAYGDEPIAAFYSDSASDLPMARLAESAFLVRSGVPRPWQVV